MANASARIRRTVFLALLPLVLALSACGDRSELPRKGFVMGVAIDEAGPGRIALTVQLFKPSQSVTGRGKTGKSYINIHTEDESVIEAVRDITIHLGRKAQWSHMRVILIGESLARKRPLLGLLDFFYRDHEPRLTSHVLIAKGKAADYLETAPFIENTVSQQYFLSEEESHRLAGKSPRIDLLELALQARSESETALLPYLFFKDKTNKTTPNVAGAAVLAEGRIGSTVTSSTLESILMLRNEFQSGIVEIPCGESDSSPGTLGQDAVEILRMKSRLKVGKDGDRPKLVFRTEAFVAASELSCGNVLTSEEDERFRARTERTLVRNMQQALEWMIGNRLDVLGAGNELSRRKPELWKSWKADWPRRFSLSDYEVRVKVVVLTTGTNVGKPVASGR